MLHHLRTDDSDYFCVTSTQLCKHYNSHPTDYPICKHSQRPIQEDLKTYHAIVHIPRPNNLLMKKGPPLVGWFGLDKLYHFVVSTLTAASFKMNSGPIYELIFRVEYRVKNAYVPTECPWCKSKQPPPLLVNIIVAKSHEIIEELGLLLERGLPTRHHWRFAF